MQKHIHFVFQIVLDVDKLIVDGVHNFCFVHISSEQLDLFFH